MVIDQVPRQTAHSIWYHEQLRTCTWYAPASNSDAERTYIIVVDCLNCDMLL